MIGSFMNGTFRSSKNAALLIAAFLSPTFSVLGEEKANIVVGSDWVEAPAAGYTDEDRNVVEGKVRNTTPVEMLAKAQPEATLTRLETQAGWDKFIDRFARVNKETGKPEFFCGVDDGLSRPTGPTGQVDFSPDFDREVVLVISTNNSQMEHLGHFKDIEVFEKQGKLSVFAFFLNQSAFSDEVEQGGVEQFANTRKPKSEGHIHLVSFPKRLADHTVEYRMAAQSWGRVCASFSPAITFFDAAENEPNNRAE